MSNTFGSSSKLALSGGDILTKEMLGGLFVLVTDELDQLFVEHQALIEPHRPRFVYAFGSSIVTSICRVPKFRRRNRSVILAWSVSGLPMMSSHPQSMQSGCLHHQRVALPSSHRVAVPPRLRVVIRQRAAIQEDLPKPVVRFVDDHNQAWSLHDLPGLGMLVELQQPHRQTVRIGIVLGVVLPTFLEELCRPGAKR